MFVVRGQAKTPETDRDAARRLLDWVGERGAAAVRVWRPPRQVAFGRRDRNEPGYETAVGVAREHGYPTVERDVGGRAVAYTGTTLAVARYEPVDDARRGIEARYDALQADVGRGLADVGVEARPGEPPGSFCPGEHSLQAEGKLAGFAQRVTAHAAVASGIVIVEDHAAIATVLADVYEALGVPFDPTSVGSVAMAGGEVTRIVDALEGALAGDGPVEELPLRQI